MTDTTDAAVTAEEPKAPAGHYYVTLKDRRILVKNINAAQSMLLGGLFRQLDNPRNVEESLAMMGKLMRMIESLIPEPADLTWLENGILDGILDVSDFAVVFLPQAVEDPKPKPKRPSRGR